MIVRQKRHGATTIYCGAVAGAALGVAVLAIPAIIAFVAVVAVMALVFAVWGV